MAPTCFDQDLFEHFFFDQLHSNKKQENERNLRGAHFCVPKGGSGMFISVFLITFVPPASSDSWPCCVLQHATSSLAAGDSKLLSIEADCNCLIG